jgi:hypothetical protein
VSHGWNVDDTLLIEEILTTAIEKVEKCHIARKNEQGNENCQCGQFLFEWLRSRTFRTLNLGWDSNRFHGSSPAERATQKCQQPDDEVREK